MKKSYIEIPPGGIGQVTDGYHTFDELYHHRAVLFSVICNQNRDLAWKSKSHDDGTMYANMFIVGIETPEGPATYHFNVNPYWDMFDVRAIDNAPKWDGHTAEEAIRRIGLLSSIDNNAPSTIKISKSPDADSRSSSNPRLISFKDLLNATDSHINDVQKGLNFFARLLIGAGIAHDITKLSEFEDFHQALTSGNIKNSKWYDMHINKERHHLLSKAPSNINLIDVIEHLVDCVMAGLARSGEIYDIDLPDVYLQNAHKNTVELLKKNVKVIGE